MWHTNKSDGSVAASEHKPERSVNRSYTDIDLSLAHKWPTTMYIYYTYADTDLYTVSTGNKCKGKVTKLTSVWPTSDQ